MQSSTAKKLRQDWGNAFCYHPMFDKEYASNRYTEKYVCLICGKSLDEEEYKNFDITKEVTEVSPDSQ